MCVCLCQSLNAQSIISGKNIELPDPSTPISIAGSYLVKASENIKLKKGTTPTNGFNFDANTIFQGSFHAKIDLDLIQDVTTESPPTNIFAGTNRSWNSSKEVGKIPGNYAVDGSGGLSYSIPIQLSPGSNGVQPNLSITYSSNSNSGNVGMGWSISGMSSIGRGGKTKYYDGISEIVQLDGTDPFFTGRSCNDI